jgi:hypothetical protein
MTNIRTQLISLCVKALRASYGGVNRDNVLTDPIYREFAKSSLQQTLDDDDERDRQLPKSCRAAIVALMQEIDSNGANMTP